MINDKARPAGHKCVSVLFEELMHLGNRAKELSVRAAKSKAKAVGSHQTRFQGRGMEFAESRLYRPGDDVRNIDWRVTARAGKPHTKLFTVEKERPVLLCVDLRAAMFFATQGVFKSVQAATIAGYIAWNASLTGNRIGGMVFDDTGHVELRPKLGKRGLLPFLQALAAKGQFPPPQAKAVAFSIDEAIASIASVATPGSLIFIISDFRKVSAHALEQVSQISRHADISLCLIYDPFEAELPKNGFYPITDGKQKMKLNTFDRTNNDCYQLQFRTRENNLQAALQRNRFMKCSTSEDGFLCLRQHFYA